MRKLILNNFALQNDGMYSGKITFGDYLQLIEDRSSITIPELSEAEKTIAKGEAEAFNENKNIKKISDYQVTLQMKKIENIEIDGKKLTIYYDEIELLDGAFETLVVSGLDERFTSNLLNMTICILTTN